MNYPDFHLYATSSNKGEGFIRGRTFGYKKVTYDIIDDKAIFEGDIIIRPIKEINEFTESQLAMFEENRWPDGIIPYQIDSDLPNRQLISDAFKDIEEKTAIRFHQYNNHSNSIHFKAGTKNCFSHVGMIGGEQPIILSQNCNLAEIIHVIGHSLGLWHEHSRKDRDTYVKIIRENIQPREEDNFYQYISDNVNGEYDYCSIMHFWPYAFSKNRPTIEVINDEFPCHDTIGLQNGLSQGDIKKIQYLYSNMTKGFQGWIKIRDYFFPDSIISAVAPRADRIDALVIYDIYYPPYPGQGGMVDW